MTTVSTTPVTLNDGTASLVRLGNVGNPGVAVTVTWGPRSAVLAPGYSLDVHPNGSAVSAVASSGSTTITVDTTPTGSPPVIGDPELAALVERLLPMFGPAVGSDNWLKAHAADVDALIRATTITRNGSDVATGANVVWPDGTAGVYAGTVGVSGAIDSYTVTYLGTVTKTVTQPTVTRNAGGAVTTLPALTVS